MASSVEPLHGNSPIVATPLSAAAVIKPIAKLRTKMPPAKPKVAIPHSPPRSGRRITGTTLDATWDRKLKTGSIAPDFTLDLHDHFLDAAHERLDSGMHQARAMGARLVLVITGRSRPVEAADRASKRGVIRAKLLDWLAAGDHADAIAAIRKAHRRHGGEGALYIVLRRNR
ncbi:MAG: Smr/MutS family protein [Pontixanthobacter sp.]